MSSTTFLIRDMDWTGGSYNPGIIKALPKAGLEAGLDGLLIVKRTQYTTIRVASRLLEAGLEVGLDDFVVSKRMKQTSFLGVRQIHRGGPRSGFDDKIM